MTTTAPPTKCSYRKTQAGKWVVMGPASTVRSGSTVTVCKRDGSSKTESIESVGQSFMVSGVAMVYGYPAERKASTTRGCGMHHHHKPCVSGGNCSSFGSGRSCGGCDCDGF